jgi:hypothetical protein
MKKRRKEKREAQQKSNKRKGFGDCPLLDDSWSNWDGSGPHDLFCSFLFHKKRYTLLIARDNTKTNKVFMSTQDGIYSFS